MHGIVESAIGSLDAMDSGRLSQLHELMREARASGELEKALAQSSTFPPPAPPSRRNVPLSEYQQMLAAIPKQGPIEVSERSLNLTEQARMTAMSQMELQQPVPPKAVHPLPSAVLSQVAASSNMAPVSVAKTNPMQVPGINRMRLAHEINFQLFVGGKVWYGKLESLHGFIFASSLVFSVSTVKSFNKKRNIEAR